MAGLCPFRRGLRTKGITYSSEYQCWFSFFLMLRKQRKGKRMFWTTVFSTCIFSSIQLYSLRLRNGASLDSYYSWKEEFPPLPLNVSDTLSLLFPCPTVEITLTQNQKIITRKLQTVFLKKKKKIRHPAITAGATTTHISNQFWSKVRFSYFHFY